MTDATSPASTSSDRDRLAAAVTRTATALERQNSLRHRFLSGIAVGVGTAIGASLIASVVLVSISSMLRATGVRTPVLDSITATEGH